MVPPHIPVLRLGTVSTEPFDPVDGLGINDLGVEVVGSRASRFDKLTDVLGIYATCPSRPRPSQRTATPAFSATRNSGSPVRTGQPNTEAAPAANASA